MVTPVHDGEEHLAECVQSVVSQSYANWEYVVHDNCSSDRTAEIVDVFARKDTRVRYLRHDEYVDVIASYNRAVRATHPESRFCKVVGADDWLYPECLEEMVSVAVSNPSVGVVSGYRLNGEWLDFGGLPYGRQLVAGREIVGQSLLWRIAVLGSPTSVLLRSDLVRSREPFYDQSFRHADTEAAYWALMRSDFGFVPRLLTFTRRPPVGETPTSKRLNSEPPEEVRMLIRYGPGLLTETEYRQQLRRLLRSYVRWHLEQRLRPSRRQDRDVRAFHRRVIGLIGAEAPDDADVRLSMALARFLLGDGA